jgi:hypothetical protein
MSLSSDKIPSDLHSRSHFFYLALCYFMSKNSASILPESLYIMSPDQILKFIDVYGGSSIRVPSRKELGEDLHVVIALYYKHKLGINWIQIQNKMNLTEVKLAQMKKKVAEFENVLENEIGIQVEKLIAL